MSRSIVLTGVGGQGTVLASRLIARAALNRNFPVRTAETIGMAQRGGTVLSHVRYGETEADRPISSLVPLGHADLVMAFEPGEAQRALPYLMPGGALVVSRKPVQPVTSALSGNIYDGQEQLAYLRTCIRQLVVVDGDAICEACGNPRVLNVALLGAAAETGMIGMSVDEMEQAVRQGVKPRFIEMNVQALHLGAKTAHEQGFSSMHHGLLSIPPTPTV
jgi:indolepyruvate ferredoxin oxidoreductase beta subunit